MTFKRLSTIVLIAIVGTTWNAAFAASYNGSGTVNVLNAADLTVFGANSNWFEVTGVNSLGNCKGWGQGTIFRLKDDLHGQQMYATLLSAMLSQTTVTVFVDDTYTDPNGYCYAEQVFLGTVP